MNKNTLEDIREKFHMKLIKKRNCPECQSKMHPQLINLHYKKEKSDLQIEVIGIPANVCTQCFYRSVPGIVAKYIDSLVDPFYESEKHQQEKVLPTPHIGIQFPPIEKSAYSY